MKVLITGGAGYIGSILSKMLVERGDEVTIVDRFFFGEETISEIADKVKIIKDDIRWLLPDIIKGMDAVIDLAALSNDPSGELDPQKTLDINWLARVRLAKLAKIYGVSRYLVASSCSVYGFQEETVNEESRVNPLTTYAKANILWENDVLPLADDKFTVTVLRQATVYGLSPRMRFDLVINAMVLSLFKEKKMKIMRDGTQWRPFVHVKDTSKAFILALDADKDKVNKQIFNVGSNEQNYQIFPLAKMVSDALGLEFNYEWYGSPDTRSYRVNFDKIHKVLGFKAEYTPKEAAKEIYQALIEGKIKDEIKTRTVEWYKQLIYMNDLINKIKIRDMIL